MTPIPLPEAIVGSLQRYVQQGIPTGSFLRAVLSNDLRSACERADLVNRYRLFDIVHWLYNEAPAACWGSPEKVAAWIEAHLAKWREAKEAAHGD